MLPGQPSYKSQSRYSAVNEISFAHVTKLLEKPIFKHQNDDSIVYF